MNLHYLGIAIQLKMPSEAIKSLKNFIVYGVCLIRNSKPTKFLWTVGFCRDGNMFPNPTHKSLEQPASDSTWRKWEWTNENKSRSEVCRNFCLLEQNIQKALNLPNLSRFENFGVNQTQIPSLPRLAFSESITYVPNVVGLISIVITSPCTIPFSLIHSNSEKANTKAVTSCWPDESFISTTWMFRFCGIYMAHNEKKNENHEWNQIN